MNAKEKASMAEARAKGLETIRTLLLSAFSSGDPSVGHPDYAQAFGVAQGLWLAGLVQYPGQSSSEFSDLVDEVRKKTKPTKPRRKT